MTELLLVNIGCTMFGHLCGPDRSAADEDLISIVGSFTTLQLGLFGPAAALAQSDDR